MNRTKFTELLSSARPVIDEMDSLIDDALQKQSDKFDVMTRLKIIAVQECSELIKELTDNMRGKGDPVGILEEMADVIICMNTIQRIYEISDEDLAKAVNVKLAIWREKHSDSENLI